MVESSRIDTGMLAVSGLSGRQSLADSQLRKPPAQIAITTSLTVAPVLFRICRTSASETRNGSQIRRLVGLALNTVLWAVPVTAEEVIDGASLAIFGDFCTSSVNTSHCSFAALSGRNALAVIAEVSMLSGSGVGSGLYGCGGGLV